MNDAAVRTTIKALRDSGTTLLAMSTLIEGSENPKERVAQLERIEIEIERLRTLVLLLRHEAIRDMAGKSASETSEEVQ